MTPDRPRFERARALHRRARDRACEAELAGDHALALALWMAAAQHADEAARTAHLHTLIPIFQGHASRARGSVKFWTDHLYTH